MYVTAARKSASLAFATAPRGGIAPFPLMTDAVSASMPCASRGVQAALSPSLGAPAMPAVWQTLQPELKTFAPSAAAATAVPFAAVAGAVAAGLALGGAVVATAGVGTAALAAATGAAVVADAGAAGSLNLAPD